MSEPRSRFRVAAGRIDVYRLFDVADEIDLAAAEQLLAVPCARLRLDAPQGKTALEIPRPPLHVSLGRRALPLRAGTREVEVSAHLFEYGVTSVVYHLPIAPGTPVGDLVIVADELVSEPTPALDAAARAIADELSRALAPALERPHVWEGLETYQVFFVQRLEEPAPAQALLEEAPLAELLLGESSPRALSDAQREDVLKHAYSYLEDDLAVVDWNSAFVVEPSGSDDVNDLLEFATAHLLELRYYDALLDRELAALYDELGAARARTDVFTPRYLRLQRRTAALLLELSEMTERLENAVKIVGDFYLARVYQGAVRRFRLPAWEDSVLRKQQLLAGVNESLKDSADRRRSELLEIVVILLIAWEILYALVRH